MAYDWNYITSLAYLTLVELNFTAFPAPPNKINCKEAIVVSYQKYAKLTGVTVDEITCDHELDDAFLLKGLRPGLTMILYNKDKYDNRIKHTLWHEIGHIKCGHKKHGDKEEIEAHYFAAQANAPNIIIKTLNQRGYQITVPFLMECFGLSEEAAKKKKDYINRYGFSHPNEYDGVVLQQFAEYINVKYPLKTNHYHDDYFDDLEKEREKWF